MWLCPRLDFHCWSGLSEINPSYPSSAWAAVVRGDANLVVSLFERHLDGIGRPGGPGACFGEGDISVIGRVVDSDDALPISS